MDAPLLIRPETHDSAFFLARASLRLRRVHLVGVAGSGMRALADVLADWEWNVSGSDRNIDGMKASSANRMRLFQGHDAGHLSADTELVVYSDAVSKNNPELRRAAELGIPAISYFEMLGRLSAERHTVAVAGTHGKSTVTAMTAHVLVEAGGDPMVFCGASPLGKNSGGRSGRDGSMLVEACEYRANFLKLRPRQAAILNIEPDHFDCYRGLDEIEQAFGAFAALLSPEGFLLIKHDCASTRRVTAGATCRVESFGTCPEADWSVRQIQQFQGRFEFEIIYRSRPFCKIRLQTPGRHNMLNALAAAALAWAGGATTEQIASGFESFAGLHRRMERRGTWRGVTLIDDYAHHPTEVAAALETVRAMFPHRRVWCVFQPHQASRTARLLDALAASLQNADRVLVAEIFRAREGDPQPGEVAAADLARRAAEFGVEVLPVHTAEKIVGALESGLAPGDVLVTLGAGDVAKLQPGND